MTREQWIDAFDAGDLAAGDVRVVKHDGGQVAVFRVNDRELYAVDNQCPHEGYPLAKGYVVDCVVTCPWHNFKFDLRDGACVLGDEAVRTYPLRIVDGAVQIDVAGPSPEEERPRLWASLEHAMRERKLGQAARDTVRLLRVDTPAQDVAVATAAFDARYAEYGTTHALPLAVDALPIAERLGGVDATLALMQAIDMASESHQRRPLRPVPNPADPGDDPVAAGARFRAAVESEDAATAEALVRGAVARGWRRAELEPWLYAVVADHFLDFGHALIYQVKLFDLLERAGWDSAADLLGAHVFRIVNGTREETLPEWTWLRGHLDALAPRFDTLRAGTDDAPRPAVAEALVDGSRDDWMTAVVAALGAGASVRAIVDAASLAAAHRILRFDVAHDADPTLQEGWLDVTHTLTFANALRYAIERYDAPDVMRLVLFACRFAHNAGALDGPAPSLAPDGDGTVEAIAGAVAARDAGAAIANTAAYFAAERDPAALQRAVEDHSLADPLTRPIVVAHLIKTCTAAFDEARATRRPEPVLALLRLAASPIRERPVGRVTHEAIRFVVHGKVPRTLT